MAFVTGRARRCLSARSAGRKEEPMNKSLFVAIGGNLLALGMLAVGSSPGMAVPACHVVGPPAQVHSAVLTGPDCPSPIGCTSGVFTGDDLLNGTTLANADGVAESAGMPDAEPPSTISFDTIYTITTRHGTISFNDTGIADTVAGLFAERMVVIGGTGRFSHASGHLFFVGTGVTTFEADVTGEICLH
jgi:hypothetical protein